MTLTQKEKSLLKELKGQEQLCIDKYTRHSQCAVDPQLKGLFSMIADHEQKHFDTLTQLENGTVPSVNNQPDALPTFSATYSTVENNDKKNDSYLCSDLLSTEKHASSLYDTCVFEFNDTGARDVLNHIQKEEQNHGKMLYDYMSVNQMYN
jgi:rubrerythrin